MPPPLAVPPANSVPIIQVSRPNSRTKPKASASKVIKYLMLAATVLWILSMPAIGILIATGGAKSYTRVGGNHFVNYDTGDVLDGNSFAATMMASGLISGICYPTVPYAIVMVVLVVAYFATKSD